VANQLPYDLTFNGMALILLALGGMLWRNPRPATRGASE
jgi:hypothetical protein